MLAVEGQRVLVMGLGLFGGGAGAVRYLLREGAHVTVTDLRSSAELVDALELLSGCAIRYKLGGHDEEDFRNTDLVVANPGVPRTSPFLKIAEHAGVPITTEICLFVERCPAPIVGVTGTSGKTTTTSLIGAMMRRRDARTLVGGNIGGSLLDRVERITADTPVVLELSSFQLDRLGDLEWSPQISVVTNFAPNHLDAHGSLEAYLGAKRKIVVYQGTEDRYVLNADDPVVSEWGEASDAMGSSFSLEKRLERGVYLSNGEIRHTLKGSEREICPVSELQVPGRHNLANALAAACAAVSRGIPEEDIFESIRSFRGVAHRLEKVAELNGVSYLNDSISTTQERALVGLKAVSKPVILIAGGYDKGLVFDLLGRMIARKVSDLILIGQTAGAIAASVPKEAPTRIHRKRSLEDAVSFAADLSVPGSTVLLSPASASYDMFRNFEERGLLFKRLVLSMVDNENQEVLPRD